MEQTLSEWAPMPLRLILGFGFMYHGALKLLIAAEHAAFLGMLQGIGVPAAGLMAWVVGIVEFLGGIGLIIGAFVPVASVLLLFVMLVAIFTVSLPAGFNSINIVGMTDAGPQFGLPGYEVNLLYIAGLLTLLLGGPSHMSVDQRLKVSRS